MNITFSPLLCEYRQRFGLSVTPSEMERKIASLVIKMPEEKANGFVVNHIYGSVWDMWNIYFTDMNVFSISESMDGYSIRFCDVGIEKWGQLFIETFSMYEY